MAADRSSRKLPLGLAVILIVFVIAAIWVGWSSLRAAGPYVPGAPERFEVRYSIELFPSDSSEYTVVLPVPLSADGTASGIASAIRATYGNPERVLVQTEHGTGLEVTARGKVRLYAFSASSESGFRNLSMEFGPKDGQTSSRVCVAEGRSCPPGGGSGLTVFVHLYAQFSSPCHGLEYEIEENFPAEGWKPVGAGPMESAC